MKIYFDGDLENDALAGKNIAVIGYGSQGSAQVLNLLDGGFPVAVGLRSASSSRKELLRRNIPVMAIGEAVAWADIIALLIPDEEQGAAYRESIAPHLAPGKILLFGHGFAVHFGQIDPPPGIDVIMVAPKGPGPQVRRAYRKGGGVMTLVAVEQDSSGRGLETALGYAAAIGGGRAGILVSSFREECETDLFGEQAVLCGGLVELIKAGYETLVEGGYNPEAAYLECLHEVKFIADLIHQRGIASMRSAISGTAAYGGLTRGSRLISPAVKEEMKKILHEVRSGEFARQWVEEKKNGKVRMNDLMKGEAAHPIEEVGMRLRNRMLSGTSGTSGKEGKDRT